MPHAAGKAPRNERSDDAQGKEKCNDFVQHGYLQGRLCSLEHTPVNDQQELRKSGTTKCLLIGNARFDWKKGHRDRNRVESGLEHFGSGVLEVKEQFLFAGNGDAVFGRGLEGPGLDR